MEGKCQLIWTNVPSLADYKERYSKEYPDYDDDDMQAAMLDYNNTLCSAIKEKLDRTFDDLIITIGIKINENHERKFSEVSKKRLGELLVPKYNGRFVCYLDNNGDLICGEIRDDTNESYIYRYRCIKPELSEELRDDFLKLLDLNCHNEAAIELCTNRFGDIIGHALDITIPTKKTIMNYSDINDRVS